jgi:hypothetical protein
LSFSLIAGTETATPGRLIPLWLLIGPATSTVVLTSVSSTESTRSMTLPSSMSTMSPGATSPGSPSYVVVAIVAFPGTDRVVIVNSCPVSSSTGPAATRPSRILGPWRSTKMPTPRPVASDASRTMR